MYTFICHVEALPDGSYEKARLRFAHAETVVPFSCLLGLFLEESGEDKSSRSSDPFLLVYSSFKSGILHGIILLNCSTDYNLILKEKSMPLPPKPPQRRFWRGSVVAPFAGNNMLVLYSCPASRSNSSNYFVHVLHNEHPIPLPVSF